jgi:hypothetical protein
VESLSCFYNKKVKSFLQNVYWKEEVDKCDLQRMQYASFTLRSLWLSQLNSASQAFWYLHKYFFRLADADLNNDTICGLLSCKFNQNQCCYEYQTSGPDKDLFLPVDILQKLFNIFIVKTIQTFRIVVLSIGKIPVFSE